MKNIAWVEESFLFEEPVGKQVAVSGSRSHLGISIPDASRRFFLLGLIAVFFLLFIKMLALQVMSGAAYRRLAEENRQRIIPIPAERGLIYDRSGVELANNVPNFSLALIPQDLPRDGESRQRIVERLARLIHEDEREIWTLLEQYGDYSYESIIIEENLDYDTALSVQIAVADLPGIYIQRGSKRQYLETAAIGRDTLPADTLSHILGYESKLNPDELADFRRQGYLPSDRIGKTGIEKTYEPALRGTYGFRRVEVNVLGKQQRSLSEVAPIPGAHLTLTIDVQMQAKLESLLTEAMAGIGARRAAAVALDPRNGEVLALVSLPAFQNNDFSGGISRDAYQSYIENPDRPLFNRALSGVYPSGSTVKPAIAAAALEERLITPQTTVASTGGIGVGQWFFPDWLPGGHGATNLRKSLAWSVNTFYYYIGGGYGEQSGLGVEKIVDYLSRFGFGQKLGIDLPGEEEGFLPTADWKRQTKGEPWYIGDTYNLSIGQGDLLVTPLQIAAMTGAVANGGTIYVPHLLQCEIDAVTKKKMEREPLVLSSRTAEPRFLAAVRDGMRDCVIYGSCQHLARLPVAVAGKTGTAQWNSDRKTHAWFTSFAPFDAPEIVLTILIEEGGEGGLVATPVARDFYAWWWHDRT